MLKMTQIEKFLLDNKFDLWSYYQTNKRYCLELGNNDVLFVRIYSDTGKLIEVEYEHIAFDEFDNNSKVSFPSIDTLKQLKFLFQSLTKKYKK
jgi:hypothetical protein